MIEHNKAWDLVFPYLCQKSAYDRVVNTDLWIKISLVAKVFQQLVYSATGPFKAKIDIDESKSLRCFIREFNLEKSKLGKAAFQYCKDADNFPELSAIAGVSPFLENFQGKYLIDFAIYETFRGCATKKALEWLLSQMSLMDLMVCTQKYIKDIGVLFDEDKIKLFFDAMCKKTNECEVKDFFQVHLGKLLHYPQRHCYKQRPYNWMISKDMVISTEDLFYLFSNSYDFEEIVVSEIIEVLQTRDLGNVNSNGDRLIPALLKGSMPAVTLKAHLKLIAENSPSEITAKDKSGKSAISYIFEYDYSLLNEEVFTPDVLWEVREECFLILLEHINIVKVEAFLNIIKNIFSNDENFKNWLIIPYGEPQECFVDQLLTRYANSERFEEVLNSSIKGSLHHEHLARTNSNGDRLIHAILKAPIEVSALRAHLNWISEIYPFEITLKDKSGKSAISYIFDSPTCKKYNTARREMDYDYSLLSSIAFPPEVLWAVREECFQTLLQYIKKNKVKLLRSRSTQPEAFLDKIIYHFPEIEDFTTWLSTPYSVEKKSFVNELLIWDKTLLKHLKKDYRYCYDMDDELSNLTKDLKKIMECSSDDLALLKKYPELVESLRLDLFNNYLYGPQTEYLKALNRVYGQEWFFYQDTDGNTLLHYLFAESNDNKYYMPKITEIIAYMVDRGFDPNVKNKEGKSVLALVKENKWDAILPLLS